MKSDWKTFGHTSIKAVLDRQLEAGSFSHAYLFSGAQGAGKKTLALEFAGKILGTQNLTTHPDFQILDEDGVISVETMRTFIGGLSFKPFIAKKKVVILNNAHNLNTQSGNALLKTLEEPSPSTIIILISATSGLLPTIVSRCQVFTVNVLPPARLKEYAAENNLDVTEEVINLSFGSIARLRELVFGKDILEKQLEVVAEFKRLKAGLLSERLVAAEALGGLEAEELEQKFITWLCGPRPNYSSIQIIFPWLASFSRRSRV